MATTRVNDGHRWEMLQLVEQVRQESFYFYRARSRRGAVQARGGPDLCAPLGVASAIRLGSARESTAAPQSISFSCTLARFPSSHRTAPRPGWGNSSIFQRR